MSQTNRIVPLPWDSDHFGLSMGRIEADGLDAATALRLVEEARAQGLALAEAFCEANDDTSVAALEGARFHHLEVKVHLDMALVAASRPQSATTQSARDAGTSPAGPDAAGLSSFSGAENREAAPDRTPPLSTPGAPTLSADPDMTIPPATLDTATSPATPKTTVSPATPDMAPALAEAFCRSFAGSRYLRTPGVTEERVHALYATWIDKSVRGTFDHVCLTLARAGRTAGVCTLRFDGSLARIGLFALGDDFRGQGLGHALLRGVADHARKSGASTLSVATQGRNISALRLYGRAGFLVRRMQLCMYRRLP